MMTTGNNPLENEARVLDEDALSAGSGDLRPLQHHELDHVVGGRGPTIHKPPPPCPLRGVVANGQSNRQCDFARLRGRVGWRPLSLLCRLLPDTDQPSSDFGMLPVDLDIRHEIWSKNQIDGSVAKHLAGDVNVQAEMLHCFDKSTELCPAD
jgi:hypothetical protein